MAQEPLVIHGKTLSGAQMRKRAARIHSNALKRGLDNPNYFGAGVGVTLRQAQKQAQGEADLKYGPSIQQVQQLDQSTPGWYQAYRNALGAAQTQNQALGGQAAADIQSRSQQAQDATGQSVNQTLDAMRKDAASRGATVDPSLGVTAAQAYKGQGNATNDTLGRLQGLTQNENNYLGNLSANSVMGEAQKRSQLAQQIVGLKGQSADYRNQQLAAHEQQLRNTGIALGTLGVSQQNAVTAATSAAGLNASRRSATRLNKQQLTEKTTNDQALLDLKHRAADLADSANQLAIDQFSAKYGITPKHFASLSDSQKVSYLKRNKITVGKGGLSSKSGGPSAGELSKSRTQLTSIENAINATHQLIGAGSKDPDAIKQVLTQPKKSATATSPGNPFGGYDALVAQAAVEIVHNPGHRLSQRTARALRGVGVIVPKRWRPLGKSGAQAEPNT